MVRHVLPITALLLVACPKTQPPGEGPADFEEIKSDQPHDANPQVSDEEATALIDANHRLALDLYHRLREGDAANRGFSISPYSLQTAFGMVYGGTVEPARAEMAQVLHLPLGGERQHVGLNWLDAQLNDREMPALSDGFGPADPVIVDTANGVWIREDLATKISSSYLDLLAIHYDAGVYLARFQERPEVERTHINAWVSQRTHQLIPELLPGGAIDQYTRVVLINALYLKAPWLRPFDEAQTSPGPFTRLDGTIVDVPMMRSTELEAGYAEAAGWQALALPMRGGELELVIILPDDFEPFESQLDQATLDQVLQGLTTRIVDTAMPRFRLEAQLELTDELRTLGMNAPFDDDNSFDGILPDLGVITTVVHQTVIQVDEKGTEAAAATGIVIGKTNAMEPEAAITVDRPFLVAIRDRPTGTLLFLGRVLEP